MLLGRDPISRRRKPRPKVDEVSRQLIILYKKHGCLNEGAKRKEYGNESYFRGEVIRS